MMEGRNKKNSNSKIVIWKEEDLSEMGLASLPSLPSINLASITKLDLSRNNLETIAESATARMVNVVELYLQSNQLKVLPNSIGCLSKLRFLDASGNSLDSLPKTIQNCRALEELFLNFNQLTQLPDSIGLGLTNLRLLSVHSNKLSFLPSTTHKLTSLRSLDAHLNCLLTLPKDIHLLPFLHSIDVSQNFHNLHSLPDSIGLLPSLSHLNVSYNCVSALPDSLACAASLRSLRADGNPLISPPFDVVENGADAVRAYLIERMNGVIKPKAKGKAGWLWRMARCGMVKGRVAVRPKDHYKEHDDNDDDDDDDGSGGDCSYGYKMMYDKDYHSVDGFVMTPGRQFTQGHRYMGLLSTPLRVFSRQWSTPANASPIWK